MRAAIFALGILLSFTTESSAFNTIWCGEPKGVRYDYQPSGEMTLDNDGFSGVQLLFRIDPQESTKLLVYWGDTPKLAQSPLSELYRTGEEPMLATIIRHDASTLTALLTGSDTTWVYTFFQEHKIGLYSRHKSTNLIPPPVSASMMFSTCRFATR